MPTRSGWAVLVGAAAGFAAARLLGVLELYVLSTAAVAVVVIGVIWVWWPAGPLAVTRRVRPPRVAVGGIGRVELAVTNRGRRRVPPVTLRDPVEGTVGARLVLGPLTAATTQEVGYRLPTVRRGPLHIGPLRVELTDPFGVARRTLPGTGDLVVIILPAVDHAPTLPLGGGRHEPLAGLSHRTVTAAGAEDLVTLRPYVVGDDLRRVHWPSTARTDELQVRRDEERWQGHLTVVLDAQVGHLEPAAFERAVSAAAGIVQSVAESGDRLRLIITGGVDSGMVDAMRGAGALMEDLAMAAQHADPAVLPTADPRLANTVLVLTGPTLGPILESVEAAGFDVVTPVRFVESLAAATSEDAAAGAITVVAGESFASAWHRFHSRTGMAVGPS